MKTRKSPKINTEAELKAILENEAEANQFAAKCLAICAIVGALAWLFNLVGIFVVPATMMNIGMPLTILFFLIPTLMRKIVDTRSLWVKYVFIFCGVLGIFILSSAMPKHSLLAWTVPLVLSCHYYSKKLTQLTLFASWIFFSASIYISMFIGQPDINTLITPSGARNTTITPEGAVSAVITGRMIGDVSLFFVFPRALTLWGISTICNTVAGRTRKLLDRQIKDSEERQRISTELDVATRIQADMLPCIFPAFPDRQEFDIYATMNPAKEVGGDFYDFFMVDETHLAIVMADVSGKGVPAALFMVIGKTLLSDHTKPGVDLGDVFEEVNELLCRSNSEGLFITAFEGVLDLVTGEFQYVNAGHEMPFLARAGGIYEAHKLPAGFVLAGMEGMKYQSGSTMLSPGDKIFHYTDGVTEATNAAHELYGRERLTEVLVKNTSKSPAELLPIIKADIDAFVGDAPQFDDITMLCVEYIAKYGA